MRHISRIAAELRRANPGKITKKAVVESLRAVDGLRAKDATAMLNNIEAEILKQQMVFDQKGMNSGTRTASPPWERGTMEQRLLNRVIAHSAVPYLMRRSTDYSSLITITDNPSNVGYTVTTSLGWKKYGRMGWMRAATDLHVITLPRGYMRRVVNRNLRIVDGLPTLDASPMDSPNGCELFAAKWARQGQGYRVHVDTGFIARSGDKSFHGKTAKSALQGLERKIAGARFAGRSMDQLAADHGDRWVSIANVKAVGACDYGIKSWVDRTGMHAQLEAGGATVKEIATGYALCPAPEARAAVLYALRKQRTVSV
jgi:hypothetical protein